MEEAAGREAADGRRRGGAERGKRREQGREDRAGPGKIGDDRGHGEKRRERDTQKAGQKTGFFVRRGIFTRPPLKNTAFYYKLFY